MDYNKQISESNDFLSNDFVKVGLRQLLADKYIDIEKTISNLNLQLKGKISLFDLYKSEVKQVALLFDLDEEIKYLMKSFLKNECEKKKDCTTLKEELDKVLDSLRTDISNLIECENQEGYQEYRKKIPDVSKNAKEKETEVDNLVKKSSPLNFRQYLHQESNWLSDMNTRKYNEIFKNITSIAVLGRRGAGKSSFINALRNIPSYEDDAAETGVTECTLENKCYELRTSDFDDGTENTSKQKKELIYVWDFPGNYII